MTSPVTRCPKLTTLCSICREPQYQTPGGASCINGHGGAPGIETGGDHETPPCITIVGNTCLVVEHGCPSCDSKVKWCSSYVIVTLYMTDGPGQVVPLHCEDCGHRWSVRLRVVAELVFAE